ncbi:MAG TPA: hypothetical protein VFV93_16985 [Thermomicrobiales bacterium]|nr:hypothetical protein [Thermomicrobiales bacterium]
MTPTLWVGIIVIVCILEFVRIGMTTYVLVHLLESHSLRRQGEESGAARRSLQSASARARREFLLDPTLTGLRAAMDEVAVGRAGPGVQRAIEALDRYALAVVDERR